MTRDRLRLFRSLRYKDPRPVLVSLRALEIEVALSDLPPKVKALRTHELNRHRELRDACLFCYGMGQLLGVAVAVADHEAQDHDFVATWAMDDDTQHFATVQLKDAVPHALNPKASVQGIIDGLAKYASSRELAVAIHLSQNAHFDPAKLVIPKLAIGSLWVFAAITPDQSTWSLWGNFLEMAPEDVRGTVFKYPTGPSA